MTWPKCNAINLFPSSELHFFWFSIALCIAHIYKTQTEKLVLSVVREEKTTIKLCCERTLSVLSLCIYAFYEMVWLILFFLVGPNDEKWHFEWILIDTNLFINDVIQSIRAKWAQENNNQPQQTIALLWLVFFIVSAGITFAPIIFQITENYFAFHFYSVVRIASRSWARLYGECDSSPADKPMKYA